MHWVAALHESGLPVPRPLPQSPRTRTTTWTWPVPDPSGTWAHGSALSWLEGDPAPRRPGDAERAERARVMAGLHEHACRWTPPPGPRRPALRPEYALGQIQPILFQRMEAALGASLTAQCRQVHALAWPLVAALPHDPPDGGLAHCDLVASNLLVADGQVRVIDFDDARYAPFAHDLVTGASEWLDIRPDGPPFSEQMAPFLAAYATVRRPPPMTESVIWACAFLRALGVLSWSIQRGGQGSMPRAWNAQAAANTKLLLARCPL